MNSTTHPNLQAPVIPVAEADGLIKLSDLTQDIVMHVPVYLCTASTTPASNSAIRSRIEQAISRSSPGL